MYLCLAVNSWHCWYWFCCWFYCRVTCSRLEQPGLELGFGVELLVWLTPLATTVWQNALIFMNSAMLCKVLMFYVLEAF